MFVYVLDKNGQPLMPTSRFGKVRRMLRDKKAKVVKSCPFTIRLLYEPETKIVQDIILGVDTGSKHVGVACIGNDKVLYQSHVELRDDIKKKMDSRRMYRKHRRFRKTRYRKCRFLNRRNSIKKDRLPPSVQHKVQTHIDEIEFCKKILPISDENIVLEVSKFDTALMKNPRLKNEKIKHWGYQKGFNYGHSSRRKAVLHRDNYTCQCCGKKNCQLQTHHIIFRSRGGSDDENNMITLCKDCHKGIHSGTITLDKNTKKMNLKHASHMNIVRSRLLRKYPGAIETFGFVTSDNRNHLKLEKTHYIDACIIASGGADFIQLEVLYQKRRVSKQDRQLCKGTRGEKKLPTGKVFGFKKFDKVEYLGERCFLKGRRSSGSFVLMDIDGSSIDFRSIGGKQNPYYKVIKRVNARKSALCISKRVEREERPVSVVN